MTKSTHLQASDLRGLARLTADATTGLADLVEAMHHVIARPFGIARGQQPERTGGITGLVYKSVRGVTRLVGGSLDAMLALLKPTLAGRSSSRQREAVLAALNGVLGDYLQASANPLAIPMSLRHKGHSLHITREALAGEFAQSGGKIVLLVHGLCLDDLCWSRRGHDHGAVLERELGYTPVYLRYNSGLHVSTNGQALAELLDSLIAHWPCPVEELVIVAHSMGGLVARSACHYGKASGHAWPRRLRRIAFLGTPHHGAPLERAGNWVDLMLGATPWSAPFARLGKIRSAGITDLRHGHVQDVDWQSRDQFDSPDDHRVPLPLPEGVACFTVAASLVGQRGLLADRLMGDGLVPLRSALGQHDEPARRLVFAKDSQHIVYRTGHLELLSSPVVAQQLLHWLAPRA